MRQRYFEISAGLCLFVLALLSSFDVFTIGRSILLDKGIDKSLSLYFLRENIIFAGSLWALALILLGEVNPIGFLRLKNRNLVAHIGRWIRRILTMAWWSIAALLVVFVALPPYVGYVVGDLFLYIVSGVVLGVVLVIQGSIMAAEGTVLEWRIHRNLLKMTGIFAAIIFATSLISLGAGLRQYFAAGGRYWPDDAMPGPWIASAISGLLAASVCTIFLCDARGIIFRVVEPRKTVASSNNQRNTRYPWWRGPAGAFALTGGLAIVCLAILMRPGSLGAIATSGDIGLMGFSLGYFRILGKDWTGIELMIMTSCAAMVYLVLDRANFPRTILRKNKKSTG